ncbi:NTP transferase domain-containing protein [Alteribacillus sp. YIM 98480]|uniref:nucleotidyltransferase family protein n=1 Tax=Alteribacillus sp. YIM 98480 TaxID=2606599 RepID=UPI00131A761B|nr:nucleotidyltransferase family protein [Alteribacillus sp. YIM 98480]
MGDKKIKAVILASGMSRRMKTAKQLLPYKEGTLLSHCIKNVLQPPFDEVIAVVGHQQEHIKENVKIADPRFRWKYNKQFQHGQSSALKCVVPEIQEADGIMVFLADQPLIQTKTMTKVYNRAVQLLSSSTDSIVIQPSYRLKKGHPVFFSHDLFDHFYSLSGDEGGKRVIQIAQYYEMIDGNDSGILFDIDSWEDYEQLLQNKGI